MYNFEIKLKTASKDNKSHSLDVFVSTNQLTPLKLNAALNKKKEYS